MEQKILTERQADRQWNKRYCQKDKQTDSETKDIDTKTSRQTVEQKILTGRQTDRQ